jgi:hypothetical protein
MILCGQLWEEILESATHWGPLRDRWNLDPISKWRIDIVSASRRTFKVKFAWGAQPFESWWLSRLSDETINRGPVCVRNSEHQAFTMKIPQCVRKSQDCGNIQKPFQPTMHQCSKIGKWVWCANGSTEHSNLNSVNQLIKKNQILEERVESDERPSSDEALLRDLGPRPNFL